MKTQESIRKELCNGVVTIKSKSFVANPNLNRQSRSTQVTKFNALRNQ